MCGSVQKGLCLCAKKLCVKVPVRKKASVGDWHGQIDFFRVSVSKLWKWNHLCVKACKSFYASKVFCIFKTFSFFCFSLPPSCINMHIFSGSGTRVIWFLSIIFLIIMPLIGMTRVSFLIFFDHSSTGHVSLTFFLDYDTQRFFSSSKQPWFNNNYNY